MINRSLKYSPKLAERMYLFFLSYDDKESAPSFSKFARSIGTTLATLEGFRQHGQFETVWKECNEIRRDYLTDRALTKKFDPTFTKHLLSSDEQTCERDDGINVTIRVES